MFIDLKRNSKYEFVHATGKRTRSSSIYRPNQKEDFKLSRSKFSDFLLCQRCFYLDRVEGLQSPGTPGWSLNETTDLLLKKEFDECRESREPHRVCIEHGLDYLIPFAHPDMDRWRDSMRHGLISRFRKTNIILSGGIDDIWLDTRNDQLVVVDYKSQASNYEPDQDYYLSAAYREGYKIQMDFYAYLLECMKFDVSSVSYFLVCNADRNAEGFFGRMDFSETLIEYRHSTKWIPGKVSEMIEIMNSTRLPESNPSCNNCAYAKQRKDIE